MTVVLAVSLRAGDTIRVGHRFDVTTDMPEGVWKAWRLCTAQRGSGEHVHVAVVADGMPLGSWRADHTWPRESSDVIARARADQKEHAEI